MDPDYDDLSNSHKMKITDSLALRSARMAYLTAQLEKGTAEPSSQSCTHLREGIRSKALYLG